MSSHQCIVVAKLLKVDRRRELPLRVYTYNRFISRVLRPKITRVTSIIFQLAYHSCWDPHVTYMRTVSQTQYAELFMFLFLIRNRLRVVVHRIIKICPICVCSAVGQHSTQNWKVELLLTKSKPTTTELAVLF